MYIAPEFFVGTILAFILLLFAHLFAMYNRQNEMYKKSK